MKNIMPILFLKNNTVNDWINKGTSPKIENLYRIAEFFDISFDNLFTNSETSSDSLSEDEAELLKYYKQLPENEKNRLIGRAEAIADMYAEAAPEPATAPETSGGKMSQEDIEKLIAGASAEAAPEPAPAPESSGGKMSQEDIEKLLAANAPAEPEPAKPEPEKVSETAPAGGKMSQNDIEALLNSMKEEASR